MTGVSIRRFGPSALLVEWPDDDLAAPAVRAFDAWLQEGSPDGLTEWVPGACSVALLFDRARTDADTLAAAVADALEGDVGEARRGRSYTLPICYDEAFALDLGSLAAGCRTSAEEVIRRHVSSIYQVRMIGFLPGFPYMDGLDPVLRTKRRADPRVRVPAGSVAIAGTQCGIYPSECPGGWHIVGRTPVRMFDAMDDEPALLAPGDIVRFRRIDRATFDRMSVRSMASWRDGT